MAALQMTVSGTAQDVDNLIVTTTQMSTPTFLQGATFFGNNVTNFTTANNSIAEVDFLQIDGGKLFEENITRVVVIEGLGTFPSSGGGGGGASEPVSKESWE